VLPPRTFIAAAISSIFESVHITDRLCLAVVLQAKHKPTIHVDQDYDQALGEICDCSTPVSMHVPGGMLIH
jgi:hypothetical protein